MRGSVLGIHTHHGAFVASLDQRYHDVATVEIVRSSLTGLFRGRAAIVSSFGAESAVLLDLVAQVDRDAPVLFLETGKHFPETLDYRDELIAVLGLTNVRLIRPDAARIAASDAAGDLHARDPDACCDMRKVDPLRAALAPYDAWLTGRKRHHGGARSDISVFEALDGRIKINPLAHWTADGVELYMRRRNLPRHPLVAKGFGSIGCAPCTARTGEADDARAGRWAGTAKTECGIHDRLKALTAQANRPNKPMCG